MKYLDQDSYSYRDMRKVEFKDMVSKLLPPREVFHAYTIGRTCTHGVMLNFSYSYSTVPSNLDVIIKTLNLKEFGKIVFEIDCKTNQGKIISKDSLAVIQNFLERYSTESSLESSTS